MQETITSHNKTTKHLITVAFLTLVIGYISAYLLPGYVDASGLNMVTVFAIAMGAIVGALATAKISTGNLVMDGLVGAVATSVITAIIYGAFQQTFTVVFAFVFVGSFLATVVSKKFHK